MLPRLYLISVSGLGFGIISGAFSLINVLADSTGPGTIGIHGDSGQFFITSGQLISNCCWILSFNLRVVTWRPKNKKKTRLHSSRMHTARLLPVSPSMHWPGGSGPGGGAGRLPLVRKGVRECIPACNGADPPYGQNSWHTLLKILPCPNFVVGSNNKKDQSIVDPTFDALFTLGVCVNATVKV